MPKRLLLLLISLIFSLSLQAETCEGTIKNILLTEWSELSREAKIEKLYNNIETREIDSISLSYSKINDPTFRQTLNEMTEKIIQKAVTDSIDYDLEVMDNIFTIGKPTPFFVDIFKIDNNPVALELSVIQEGGATVSGASPFKRHYTLEEVVTNEDLNPNADVDWLVHSYFEFDGKEWKELKIDIFDEGFRWSGW